MAPPARNLPSSLSTEALRREAPSGDGGRLVVVEGPDVGAALELLAGVAVVGKSRGCNLRLSDSAVSAEHLRVEVVAEGFRVSDLASTNGTFYLGSRLEQAVLPHGSVLRLGRTRLALASREMPAGVGYSARAQYGAMLGRSPAMRRLFALLERIESTEYTVLVQGETGVGKDLVAREIHQRSSRRDGPYEVLDCAAISTALAESQLFGHVKGAFTGAHADHAGVFERSSGGTAFLDEIGELPLELQPKLLRALENHQVMPVGGKAPRAIDARVIAATNRELIAEVRAGRFREDLYYRLNVVSVEVPPLRQRREDVPDLVHHFLQDMRCADVEVSPDTVELFTCGYDWPGNVRELRNAIARVVSLGAIPDDISANALAAQPPAALEVNLAQSFQEAKRRLVDAFERDYLASQLARADGNLSQAARLSGVDRSYFKRLLRRHGLRPESGDS